RGQPFELPAHASAKALDLGEWRARDGDEGNVAMREMHGHAVDVVGHVRAARAALFRARRQHEVLDQELPAAVEQIAERLPAVRPVEGVLFVDTNPGQLPAQLRDLVAAPRQVLLGGEQIAPRFEPGIACYGWMYRHDGSPFMARFRSRHSRGGLPDIDREIDLTR